MSESWWGVPGGNKAARIHYTLGGHYPKPLCGVRVGSLMHYQFCAQFYAPGFEPRYVECKRCRRMGAAMPPKIKLRTANRETR